MKYITLLFVLLFSINLIYANNAGYIAIANQRMKAQELDVLSNNVANANTIGFQADDILNMQGNFRLSSKKTDSFPMIQGTYLRQDIGTLKVTNRNLDIAINGEGYFKVITPKGVRYTLNGNMMISNNRLVNVIGMPFASVDGEPIILPEGFSRVDINEDGMIFADQEDVATIGIFAFAGEYSLRKEGEYLLASDRDDIAATDYTVIQGALRGSNINQTKALSDMVDLQRSVEMTNSLITTINEMEKNAVTKISK